MPRRQRYAPLFERLDSLCEGESDHVSLMATIACEIYHAFDSFHWVGFYRNTGNRTLKVGPYQGTHGCLTIPFDRGICGKCAREKTVVNIPDVSREPGHIACSATTRSEIVIPVIDATGRLIAVLDIDSNQPAAFDKIDEGNLPRVNRYFRESPN